MKRIFSVAALCIAATTLSPSSAIAGTPATAPTPSPEYCRTYNPRALEPQSQGSHFILESEGYTLATFASQADAIEARAVVRNDNTECIIGIGNELSGQYQYMLEYFPGLRPGVPGTQPPSEDCLPIASADLHTTESKGLYYLETVNDSIGVFKTAGDAERALLVAKPMKKICYIGRNDSGGNPEFVMTYFR